MAIRQSASLMLAAVRQIAGFKLLAVRQASRAAGTALLCATNPLRMAACDRALWLKPRC